MLGTIKRIRPERGFGFIAPDGDNGHGDHFFHASELQGLPFDERLVDTRVEFTSSNGPKGLVAREVKGAN